MKSRQAKPKYATYGRLVDELAKFDQAGRACVTASTDLGRPDRGKNFIDGSGVKRVGGGGGGIVTIVCGDSGAMTWGQVRDGLRANITLDMADKPAIVLIAYNGVEDANGKPCALRRVKECGVVEGDDTVWNVGLGPAV